MKKIFLFLFISLSIQSLFANREIIPLNENWTFRFSYNYAQKKGETVNLPHTWNNADALSGRMDYYRGIGVYEKELEIYPELKNKRIFIKFNGVNTIATLFLNGKYIGEHRGGYTAFIFELTDNFIPNAKNSLMIKVNNSPQLEVMPLVGDFNIYGGIYRDVSMIITDKICFSPLDHGSSGIYIQTNEVSKNKAKIHSKIILSNRESVDTEAEILVKIKNEMNHSVCTEKKTITIPANNDFFETDMNLTVSNPHLWNGTKDPYCYSAEFSLYENSILKDSINHQFGIRTFKVHPDSGFFLNNQPYDLRGVCCHHDRAEIGSALRNEHFDQDINLIREMGANSIRLAHYPYPAYVYESLDKAGIIVWTEIPFVGPGGYADKGFVDSERFKENGKQQLKELIRQNYNHPAICFWGLFNELKENGDNPCDYIRELNQLAHQEDPLRLTTSASNQYGEINTITDLIAWNRYDGWYGGLPHDLGNFLDDIHSQNPGFRIAISEYGAGGSIYHQQDSLIKTKPLSWWHPENWQTYYHEKNWEQINKRPFVWGSFIWNMFDFGASHRREGDRSGINDKGLVSFDRKEKKDAFFFYKANWNKEVPVLHISEKRNNVRKNNICNIRAFCNMKQGELFINNKSFGKRKTSPDGILEWNNIYLEKGENKICVKSQWKGRTIEDSCIWYRSN
ncbi:MAG: beta-glucuronidase LacZ4 [Bacteroidales bacterium]